MGQGPAMLSVGTGLKLFDFFFTFFCGAGVLLLRGFALNETGIFFLYDTIYALLK